MPFLPTRHPPGLLPCGRAARTGTVTLTALVTAVTGHALGGSGLPSAAGSALAVVLLAGPAWWLARDERGWERLAAAQLAAQLVAHVVFVATEPAAHAAPHGHGGLGPGIVLVAHLLSAAVAGAWLRGGERRARELSLRALAALAAFVGALTGRPGPAAPPRPPLPGPPVAPRRGVLLRHAIVHRGPPAVC